MLHVLKEAGKLALIGFVSYFGKSKKIFFSLSHARDTHQAP